MSVKDRITRKLTEAFAPENLAVIDESDLHAGHAGARPEGETHFRVEISAAAFADKSRVETHRMINGVLAEELEGRIHALAIKARGAGG